MLGVNGNLQPSSTPRPRPPDPASPAPLVSVLIPVCNRVELTQACLGSLFACDDPTIPTEILVIDDASTDGTAAYLDGLGNRIHGLRNGSRHGFGRNMNRAASLARGEFLCLLNNDTEVTQGWLAAMLAAARRDPRIGVVGNRHLTPGSGSINHAGMVFDDEGRPIHLYAGRPADFPPARLSREFQVLTAACWLVPRTLFLELGGFDPAFRNGYEDVDFCLRAREHGRTVFYVGNSVIYHHGLASPGRTDHEEANAAYFREKWRDRIVPDLQAYLRQDGVAQPVPPSRPPVSSRALAAARRLRRTWPLAQIWAVALARPGIRPVLEAAKRALLRLP